MKLRHALNYVRADWIAELSAPAGLAERSSFTTLSTAI
jgi:hypothetical protein